jgi:hypothetical protein
VPDGRFEIVVVPRSADYDEADDRWRDQVAAFARELADRADTSRRGTPAPGRKGTVDDLIVALAGSGALTAVVECIRAWLERDRNRSVEVRWDEGGVERRVTVRGEGVDAATVQEIARAAAARGGGPGWPADTAPS